MMSSTMPSANYSCSGSPLIFSNGNTAIDVPGTVNFGWLGFWRGSVSMAAQVLKADIPGQEL